MTSSADTHTRALQALRQLTGRADAEFHDGQFEAISSLVDGRKRSLVVQRTGWGKSAVYFISTLLLRQQGAGPTLLVSPLIALMRDQVAAAARAGVRAVALNSANAHEWDDVREQLAHDQVDVLLVSPERLNNPRFRDEQLPTLLERMGMLVIDEAHCISDWGHDFRPDYRRLADLIAGLPADMPVLATTATANQRVVQDVAEQLGGPERVFTIRGSLARASLRLGVLGLGTSQVRLGWLLSHLGQMTGSGIVYALTVSAAEDTARLLRDAGLNVRAYTGRTDPEERASLEQQLKDNQIKALVATSALGMGFDKPDLGFVIHLGAPSSPVAYYQQVGRAGRGVASADVLLLPGSEDREIWRYFATASMPSPERASAVLEALASNGSGPLSTPALEARVNIRRTPLELLLKVLDVDGAVNRVQGGWLATGKPWHYDAKRYERIASARVAEQQAMLRFQTSTECRMEMLQRELDDLTAQPCGVCDNCAGVWYPTSVDQQATARAAQTLDQVGVEIEPRASWPTGADRLGVEVRGRIPAEQRAEPGRALARLTDLGWGSVLRDLFAPGTPDAPATPELVRACVQVLKDWPWVQRPAAVVSMPSRTRPALVDSLRDHIAQLGRLTNLGSLTQVGPGPQHGPGGNSVFRLADVWGQWAVDPQMRDAIASLHGQPVLLIDDLVDSRWTITVAARELRQAGAGAVLPLALAVVG
jgi:ATP-dependent DNA helicase RecQ